MCSLQAVWRLVRKSVWSVGRCMGKGWECVSAAALSATMLPITHTCEGTHWRWIEKPEDDNWRRKLWMMKQRKWCVLGWWCWMSSRAVREFEKRMIEQGGRGLMWVWWQTWGLLWWQRILPSEWRQWQAASRQWHWNEVECRLQPRRREVLGGRSRRCICVGNCGIGCAGGCLKESCSAPDSVPLIIVCVCVWSDKDIKEERGNQGPKREVFSKVRKEGGGVSHPEGGKEGDGSLYKRHVGLIW